MKKREKKFRAWDKQNQCWYEPIHEAYKGNLHELMIGLSGDLFAHTMEGNVHESMFPDRFELVQFTGLKDKNEKEIFESDIVKVYGQFEVPCNDRKDFEVITYEHTGTISFESGMFVFKNHLTREKLIELQSIFEDATLDTDITSSLDSFAGIEIMGNIYENPELLKP